MMMMMMTMMMLNEHRPPLPDHIYILSLYIIIVYPPLHDHDHDDVKALIMKSRNGHDG